MNPAENEPQKAGVERIDHPLHPFFRGLEQSLPVQALRNSHENTGHHGGKDESSVLHHTYLVEGATEAISAGELSVFPTTVTEEEVPELQEALHRFLDVPVDVVGDEFFTWRDMGIALALVHDIGKDPQGIGFKSGSKKLTSSVGHEDRGADMIGDVFASPSFTNEPLEVPYSLQEKLALLIRHHGDISEPLIAAVKAGKTSHEDLIALAEQAFTKRGLVPSDQFIAVKVGILLNVIADFESGRTPGDMTGLEDSDIAVAPTGFTSEEKEAARILFTHYLKQWSFL